MFKQASAQNRIIRFFRDKKKKKKSNKFYKNLLNFNILAM